MPRFRKQFWWKLIIVRRGRILSDLSGENGQRRTLWRTFIQGDSGGPLTVADLEKRHTFVGVVSRKLLENQCNQVRDFCWKGFQNILFFSQHLASIQRSQVTLDGLRIISRLMGEWLLVPSVLNLHQHLVTNISHLDSLFSGLISWYDSRFV